MASIFTATVVGHFCPSALGETGIVVVLVVGPTDWGEDLRADTIVVGHAETIVTALIGITIGVGPAGLFAHNFAATINTLGSTAWSSNEWTIGIGSTFGRIIVCALADTAAILVLG